MIPPGDALTYREVSRRATDGREASQQPEKQDRMSRRAWRCFCSLLSRRPQR